MKGNYSVNLLPQTVLDYLITTLLIFFYWPLILKNHYRFRNHHNSDILGLDEKSEIFIKAAILVQLSHISRFDAINQMLSESQNNPTLVSLLYDLDNTYLLGFVIISFTLFVIAEVIGAAVSNSLSLLGV